MTESRQELDEFAERIARDDAQEDRRRKQLGMVPANTIWEATYEDGRTEYIDTSGRVVGGKWGVAK